MLWNHQHWQIGVKLLAIIDFFLIIFLIIFFIIAINFFGTNYLLLLEGMAIRSMRVGVSI
jgi:hypothetical protein